MNFLVLMRLLQANRCTGEIKHYPTPFDGKKRFWCISEGDCPGGDVIRCSWHGGHNWLFNDARVGSLVALGANTDAAYPYRDHLLSTTSCPADSML